MSMDTTAPSARAAPGSPRAGAQAWAGLFAGAAVGLLDALSAVLAGELPGGLDALFGTLSLAALYAPLGLALASLAGLHGRRRGARGASRGKRDPERVASGAYALFALALLGAGGVLAAELVPARFARQEYGFVALGLVIAGLGAGLLEARAWALPPLFRVARRLGPLSVPGRWGLVALALWPLTLAVLALAIPELRRALGVGLVVSAALAPPLALAVAGCWRRWGPALPAWAAAVLAFAAFAACGFTYGLREGHRPLVEERSGFGRFAVTAAQGLTDWDRDGRAGLFGGGDCNDFDASVHPGAWDAPGDGKDSDCVAGDADPAVLDLGDGAFGRRPPDPARPNFLVLTVDALRPDRLGLAGYFRRLTPNIDAVAREGAWFSDVTASSSRSIRSIPGLWSGFPPSQVSFGSGFQWPRLADENELVPELLTPAGYTTRAVMGTTYFTRARGFFQGWGGVEQGPSYQPDPRQVVETARKELEDLSTEAGPWMLWTHIFNVHRPHLHAGRPFGDTLQDQYDAEVALADELIGTLLEALQQSGQVENTVVVIASDHGEALGEHGLEGHATTLFDIEVRSTLVIRVPGLAPRRVSEPVGLIDVAPTLLNLAGVRPTKPMPARSLVPLLTGEEDTLGPRALVSELLPDGRFAFDHKAIREGDLRLMLAMRSGATQLYDVAADPGELRNLVDERPGDVARLRGRLLTWAALSTGAAGRERIIEDARLEALPETMDVELDARVPGLRVHGFDIESRRVAPGGTLRLAFYVEAERRIQKDYMLDVAFEDASGRRLPESFEGVHVPVHGLYPTRDWPPGELIRDEIEIIVPPDIAAPARLNMSFGMRETDQYRLPFRVGEERQRVVLYPVGTIDVRP
ncbi:MAG: sulfatase-like hydrolase/transferase [Myxococcota bacterium]